MGEFTDTPQAPVNQPEPTPADNQTNQGFETDVPDVFSNDVMKHGSTEFPVFDCGKDEFYQNQKWGRKRLRFKSGSPQQQYMKQTKYNKSFFIRHTDTKGDTYVRKVK